jgi:hypothetical protein
MTCSTWVRIAATSSFALALLATARGQDAEIASVSGSVTFSDNSPVRTGKIAFYAEKGKPITTKILADGRRRG